MTNEASEGERMTELGEPRRKLSGAASAGVGPHDAGFAAAWGVGWSVGGEALTGFYAEDAIYVDAAMQSTWHGHEGLLTFHRHMTNFVGKSAIAFGEACAGAPWVLRRVDLVR